MKSTKEYRLIRLALLITVVAMTFLSGCARYGRTVSVLYEPSTTSRGGSGEVSIIIPENQQTLSPDIKWVVGKITDDNNNVVDDVMSLRSSAEIIQTAFGLEFKKAGYKVVPTTKRNGAEQVAIDLTKTKIEISQISSISKLEVKCRVMAAVDVYKNGALIKKLQYEATNSKTDIKDREVLAGNVLQEALRGVMLSAMPELIGLMNK